MRKEAIVAIATVYFITVIALADGSVSNNSANETNISKVENTALAGIDMERYVWYNGDREEQVFVALDEIAIFPKNVSETTNVTELIRSFDPKAALIKDYKFVTIELLPDRFNRASQEEKMAEFHNKTGNNANFVFYIGPKKDQAPMALTGEIIVEFKQEWNETKITNWAKDMGLNIIRNYYFSPNTYLFDAGPGIRSLEIANQIYLSGQVNYAYPNWWKTMTTRAMPNDTLYPDQWHLNNTGQSGGTLGEDVNITPVWEVYRGSDNEVIAIVDDGLELLHEDLAPNILSGYSWDYVGNDPDPTAGDHGTSVAGVAAGRGWNALGITGAAPYTKLVGYRYAYTDDIIARALSNNTQIVDIYSNSWGPSDDRRLESPGNLTKKALANGTSNGRSGKGNIYVWAGGNGNNADKMLADNSNYDGYANSHYVLAVAASSNFGDQSWYSEEGANILVNAPSNGGSLGITTTDRTDALGYSNGNYTNIFGGTSSAAPLVSGIISLMLQANPNLTWRDVRLIIAKTANKNDPTDIDWTRNGADYNINHKYGFGRIDAYAAVNTAAHWTTVGSEISTSAFDSSNLSIPDNNLTGVSDTINITQNIGIEFVEINFTADDHTYWGDLEIELTSPSGTSSTLAETHAVADGTQRYDNWIFGSVRYLGESSQGTWQLTVRDLGFGNTGTFQKWGLRIYGNQFLPDWKYRKQKTITGTTAGAQTNYQMKLTVYKGSGTDTNGTVYLGGNVKDDFSDLRFTKSDGVTLLDYWIESYTSGVSAVVWVEVDSIPASPGTADIYVYYGNPSATSASSGAATFLFFDDFSQGTSANYAAVSGTWQYNATQQIEQITGGTDGDTAANRYLHNTFSIADGVIEAKVRYDTGGGWYSTVDPGIAFRMVDNNNGYAMRIQKDGAISFRKIASGISSHITWASWSSTPFGTWVKIKVIFSGNTFKIYTDDVIYITRTDASYSGTGKIGLYRDRGGRGSYDDLRVRKYVSPEPTWAS